MKLKEILKIDINKIKASINPRLNSRRKSILVIDDDIAVGEALKFIYPEWTVLAAKTAEEGLDYLEHNPKAPDLIFLDYQLPKMDGLTCLNLIKERPLSSKIILLSGYEALGDILKHTPNNADGFLVKPFELEALKSIVSILTGSQTHITSSDWA